VNPDLLEAAFYDELEKIALGGQLGKGFAELGRTLSSGVGQVGQGAQKALFGQLIPTGVAGAHGAGEMMLRKGGLLGGLVGSGHRLEQAGMGMRETMAQRVAKAPGLAAAARATNPAQMAEITEAAKAMGRSDPGAATRIGSHMVESVGHHAAHATPAGMVFKSVGIPLGGAMEGFSRGAGRELRATSSPALQRAGGLMERNAKRVGRIGEMAGVPALALGAHIPLGAAGLVGGKLLGAAVPALTHGLHGAGAVGEYAHHALSDVAGDVAQRGAAWKAKFLGGRMGGRAGQLMQNAGDALT
jgi:hypothetical protein